MRSVVWCLVAALAAPAAARAAGGEDAAAAARLFEDGRARYDRGDFEGARRRWEAARQLAPTPELDYDIGRCWDRLGHADEAAREYRRYLDQSPHARNAAAVRARLALITARPAAPPPASGARRLSIPIVVGSVALAGAVVGSALVGSVAPEYDRLRDRCAGACQPAQWSGLEARADAGYALWAVAGAAAVADAVLWAVALRRHGREARALATPAGASAPIEVRF